MSDDPDTDTAPVSLQQLVLDSVTATFTPEYIEGKVKTAMEKLIDRSVSDALTAYSGTGKVIKDAVTESLRVVDLDLPSYGSIVQEILSRQIQARVSEVVATKLEADMESLLSLAPKAVKLSKIIEELLGADDDPCECDGPSEVFMEIEWDDDRQYVWMYISKEKPTSKYENEIRLLLRLNKKPSEAEKGEHGLGIPLTGTICSGTVKGSDLKKDSRFGYGTEFSKQRTQFGRWFGLEQRILAMYAVETVITLDEDSCILSHHD